ncbi:hypothetical protein RN001_008320 [Aquatica leii]|uniref:Peptidase S1 domain-containing protein n=1 Tax=Aquatica leii TaxID=1421715 RepID=A0AAN7PXA3_9COLE|nr:hypothetical protein RN001_008320 [Aquatica leii]
MRLLFYITTALLVTYSACDDEFNWSWNNDDDFKPSHNLNQDEIETAESSVTSQISDNSTVVETIVDNILSSNRQGRNLNGYDELYSDPNVQEALQNGDDREARNVIKEKLCSLGLMQCEGEFIQGKRPYISPEELVYAQPVDIKPIGRPIPSIPVKQPIRNLNHYGPPRPNPIPPKFGPPLSPNSPPRRGYGPPQKPFYTSPPNKPFINGPPIGSYYEESEGFLSKPPGPIYSQPIEPDHSYDFEHHSTHYSSSHTQNGPVGASGLQQHVHHHFHHTSGNSDIKVPVQSVVAENILGNPASSFTATQTDAFYKKYREDSANALNKFNPSFTVGGSGFTGSYGGQTIANYGGQTSGSYGGLGSFGTSKPFWSIRRIVWKYRLVQKELNINNGALNSIQSNYLQSTYAGNYKGIENFDCVCVPFNQCPSHDVIGRKDDLFLALDPRNLKNNIDALTEERVITDGNGTMTVVRVPKEAKDPQSENKSFKEEEAVTGDQSKIVKRETPVDKENSTQYEARQNFDNRRVKPTFGVSFGLPHQGGGGYPLNPYGPYPLVNPYGGTIGGGGINLGLVSINPLLSVQVTKDDYGEKIVKPFVNLHVTPNDFLVHKLDNLFTFKKQALFNKHKHYHHHDYPKPIYHKPHDHFDHYDDGPYLHEHPGPIYSPEYDGPPINNFYPGNYAPAFGADYEGGYDDDYYGRAHLNNTYRKGKELNQNNYDYNSNYDPLYNQYQEQYANGQNQYGNNYNNYQTNSFLSRNDKTITSSNPVKFPKNRKRRNVDTKEIDVNNQKKRQAHYLGADSYGRPTTCGPRHVCCKRPLRPNIPTPALGNLNQCGTRHSQGINGRIKNPAYVDGDSEFGEYPWQVAILKKDPKESVYVCGGTLIDSLHIITAAHCVRSYSAYDLRVRLGEWDVNHDVEFYPYIERDITALEVHPEFYAGTLYNDLAVMRIDKPVDFSKHPHISPACLPHPQEDYSGHRCWTTDGEKMLLENLENTKTS